LIAARKFRVLASLLAAVVLTAACVPSQGTGSAPSASPKAPARHVFVIVLENTSYQLAMQQPYIKTLAQRYAVATNYHDLGEPSLPNYLAMTSGSTWGVEDNEYHQLPATGIGNQLTEAKISWKAYMEGFTGDCFDSPYPYALKHNPFPYYGGECPSNVVPMDELETDLQGKTPMLSWITPGLCNDGHDCGVRTADRWLSVIVPQITSSKSWKQNGSLFITWDESDANDTRVALLVVTPKLRGTITTRLDHFSLLATISDLLGVGRLGSAKQATSLHQQLVKAG
jgi:phosphatidylinositol-3-phosphatase